MLWPSRHVVSYWLIDVRMRPNSGLHWHIRVCLNPWMLSSFPSFPLTVWSVVGVKGWDFCVVTSYSHGKHLTHQASVAKLKKQNKKRIKKRTTSDCQNPLKTESQSPVGARAAKWHQQPAARGAVRVTFPFFCLHSRHDSQLETIQLPPDCQSHSSQLHVKHTIADISDIRFQSLCLTSVCCEVISSFIASANCACGFGCMLEMERERNRTIGLWLFKSGQTLYNRYLVVYKLKSIQRLVRRKDEE